MTGNVINNTVGAITLSTNASNNTVQDNSISLTSADGIWVTASANNTVFRNTFVNHTNSGIRVENALDNYVRNNTLAHSAAGTSIDLSNSNRTLVEYNNASASSQGLSLAGNNNTVRYNRFINHSGRIVELSTPGSYSDYNVFHGNVVENSTGGDLMRVGRFRFGTISNNTIRSVQQVSFDANAINNTFIYNNVSNTGQGGLSVAGSNNTFQFNNVSYAGWVCVIASGALDSYFDNNVYQSCGGLQIDTVSTALYFTGERLLNITFDALNIAGSSTGLQFTNLAISPLAHIGINGSSSAVLLNVTFDKADTAILDEQSNLTYRWYVRANVTDFDGDAWASANVTIMNTTRMNESGVNLSQVSDAGGLTPYVAVTEAFVTTVSTNNVSAYNFTASRLSGLYSNSTLYAVTGSGTVRVVVNIPPTVVLTSPTDSSLNSSRTVLFQYMPTDQDNQTFLNCSVWTNETAWSIKASNASSITNGSNNTISVTFSSDGFYRWNVGCFDRAGEGAFSTSNFTIRIDTTAPSGFAYISPTLANGSESALNYSEVNVSFTEANPDSCL
ncbi:right-handed parallel beta-helix repeat-containing protein, partial [Candidatus Micrarchaeota archaeon]|nr:right-handed parallel beta-helix repeat-containing protein [Candidatus Micrarchaeota archaeon]